MIDSDEFVKIFYNKTKIRNSGFLVWYLYHCTYRYNNRSIQLTYDQFYDSLKNHAQFKKSRKTFSRCLSKMKEAGIINAVKFYSGAIRNNLVRYSITPEYLMITQEILSPASIDKQGKGQKNDLPRKDKTEKQQKMTFPSLIKYSLKIDSRKLESTKTPLNSYSIFNNPTKNIDYKLLLKAQKGASNPFKGVSLYEDIQTGKNKLTEGEKTEMPKAKKTVTKLKIVKSQKKKSVPKKVDWGELSKFKEILEQNFDDFGITSDVNTWLVWLKKVRKLLPSLTIDKFEKELDSWCFYFFDAESKAKEPSNLKLSFRNWLERSVNNPYKAKENSFSGRQGIEPSFLPSEEEQEYCLGKRTMLVNGVETDLNEIDLDEV